MFATAATPAKSVCCDGSGYNSRYSNPNYMAKTESFNAKVRSHSAPKQRPEPRKRLSLQEMVESRSSLSGVGMMKSCSRAQEAISLKNTIVSRMTMIDRSSESDFYLQRRW
ncbi:hypothetical protein ZOSMA_5G01800 [Zostera marina]|uniref:DUF4005 domain-containing protein n=1 Tax=Zostera marina TaxID=29655 RepID=A0A0K9NUK4_ZOSMR|nr:hypothetical protein ZOSMA_5G01800 [Zostera marina]